MVIFMPTQFQIWILYGSALKVFMVLIDLRELLDIDQVLQNVKCIFLVFVMNFWESIF
jgi:hypothetical protein